MADPATFTNQAGVSALIIWAIQLLKGSSYKWTKFITEDSTNVVKRLLLVLGSGIGTLGLSWSYNEALGQFSLAGFQAGVPLKVALGTLAWKWFCAAMVTHGGYHIAVKNDIVAKVVAALKPADK